MLELIGPEMQLNFNPCHPHKNFHDPIPSITLYLASPLHCSWKLSRGVVLQVNRRRKLKLTLGNPSHLSTTLNNSVISHKLSHPNKLMLLTYLRYHGYLVLIRHINIVKLSCFFALPPKNPIRHNLTSAEMSPWSFAA